MPLKSEMHLQENWPVFIRVLAMASEGKDSFVVRARELEVRTPGFCSRLWEGSGVESQDVWVLCPPLDGEWGLVG